MRRTLSALDPKMLLLLCTLLLVGSAAPGFGQEEEAESGDFGRPGWYVGANGVFAVNAFRDTLGDVEGSGGANLRIGYRSESDFAIETEFEWIHRFEENLGTVRLANYRSYAVGLNGKIYMASGRIQPYGLIGVNGLTISKRNDLFGANSTSTDWAFRGGAGVELYLTRHVAVDLEASYLWAVGDVWQRDYASFGGGLLYRF